MNSLFVVPGLDAWLTDHPDNYATDPVECPQWLVDELRANETFVLEALGNAPSHTRLAAAAMARRSIELLASADACIAEYIAAAWERKPDADALSREWAKWAKAVTP